MPFSNRYRRLFLYTLPVYATFAAGIRVSAAALPAAAGQDAPVTVGADVPTGHWAYTAVGELAQKEFLKGYGDGTFQGNRAMTRYEFAVVIARMLRTLTPPSTPTPAPEAAAPPVPFVTAEDLNKLQVLVDEFKNELTAIRTDTDSAKKQIDLLRGQLTAVQTAVKKAQDTADSSFGYGPNRKFQIGGFIQSRYEKVDSGNRTVYPDGVGQGNGYNGNYNSGTNSESFKIREARLFITGQVTPNTRYLVEFGTPGAINLTATGTGQTFVRRLYGTYTFGDGSAKYPSLTFGQFWVPFGYILDSLRPTWYTPERPLAFNESPVGLFSGQEFDRGVQLRYAPGGSRPFSATVAVINGTGANSNDTNPQKDLVARITYAPTKQLSVGASSYYGRFDTLGNASAKAVKNFYGADIELTPQRTGPFLQAEYVGGKYESVAPASIGSPSETPPTGIPAAGAYLPGNKISGYYVTGGWTFNPASPRPFSLIGSYDRFNRSSLQSTRKDINYGYGAQYNLDRSTRLRLFYIKPTEVSHAPNTTAPPKIGQYTAEMQVRF